jgi:hypothetical protein
VLRIAGFPIGQIALDVSDPDRTVLIDFLAVILTGMSAYVTHDTGEGQFVTHKLQGLTKFSFCGELNIAAGIYMKRAACNAVRRSLSSAFLEYIVSQLGKTVRHFSRWSRDGPWLFCILYRCL